MKIFIYIKREKKATYGCNVSIDIYLIKRNRPISCGTVQYNTGSYRGIEHEIANHLVKNKFLPKKCTKNGGYVNYDELGKSFTLISV